MKKFTRSIVLLFCLIAFALSTKAQVVLYDWETPETTPSEVSYWDWGASYSILDNPTKDGINTSAKAGLAHTNTSEWDDFGIDIDGKLDFTSSYIITMMVKSDTEGEVLFKIKGDGQSDKEIRTQQHTGSGAWELMTYDFSTLDPVPANDAYNRIEIIFNAQNGTEGDWYFDNISVPGVIAPDGLVELTFLVTDKLNSTSMSAAFEGEIIPLTNNNNIWSGTAVEVPIGNYTWDLNVDGNTYKTNISMNIEEDRDFFITKHKVSNSDLIIPKVAAPPIIDGEIDAIWDNVNVTPMGNVYNGGFDDEADHKASFKAIWDETNLYVLVEVTDQTLVNSTGADYEKDGVEILIDIDNAGGTNYDNDKQIRYLWDDAVYNAEKGSSAQANLTGGWLIEIALPWDYIDENFNATVGSLIGFDVASTDNDASGREGTHAWMATEDNGWWNPSVFGQIELGALVPTFIYKSSVQTFSLHPNPVKDNILIKGAELGSVVKIYSMAGALVKQTINTGTNINITELNAGLYFVKVGDSVTKLIKK